jgi:hypothetical protein
LFCLETGTHYVAQAGLELSNLPAAASQVLGFHVCATMPGSGIIFWAYWIEILLFLFILVDTKICHLN